MNQKSLLRIAIEYVRFCAAMEGPVRFVCVRITKSSPCRLGGCSLNCVNGTATTRLPTSMTYSKRSLPGQPPRSATCCRQTGRRRTNHPLPSSAYCPIRSPDIRRPPDQPAARPSICLGCTWPCAYHNSIPQHDIAAQERDNSIAISRYFYIKQVHPGHKSPNMAFSTFIPSTTLQVCTAY